MKRINHLILILLTILLSGSPIGAAEWRDSLVVSLLTAWPGSEVYELCGHSALRIRDAADPQACDSVWNYGLFDFNTPNFVGRFVRGETDYMVGGYPTAWFLPEYAAAGRRVLEQELNLTQDEAHRLRALLRTESLPQNRVYRYNYVRDNCATRITARLTDAVGGKIHFPDSIKYGTFRNEMRAFHRTYPWYQFGIDLALGSGLDRDLRPDEEMFVPVVMSERYAGATMPDGRRLVTVTRELLPDSGHASLPSTPWWMAPWFVFGCISLIVAACCIYMIMHKRIQPWLYIVWFSILGIAGCVVTYLVFASSHEATSPNILISWLNPLQFLTWIGLVWASWRPLSRVMAWYDIIVPGILLIIWPLQPQSANPAIFAPMAATLVMAVTYAICDYKQSYNNKKNKKNAQDSNHRAVRTGGAGVSGTGRGAGRQATARGRNRS